MNGLIIIVHGSRRQKTEIELQNFIDSIALKGVIMQSAYMEIQRPNLQEAVQILINKKCVKITVLPFFILAGCHIDEDIPQQFAETKSKFPTIQLTLLEHLTQLRGATDSFRQLIKSNLTM